MTSPTLRKLFQPGKIGPLELRNRVVMTAMGNNLVENCLVTDRLVAYYEERAKGGVGMIVVGGCQINQQEGKISDQILGIDDERFLPGLRRLSSAIRRHGAVAALQFVHGGSVCSKKITGKQPVSASAITGSRTRETARALEIPEILAIEQQFAHAAYHAREAGFQMLELNVCSGYLIREFLSPRTNHRTDEYGGSRESRMRFMLEVIAAIRQKAGHDFPLAARITGDEFMPGGMGLEDAIAIAQALEAAGLVAIDVTVGGHETSTPLTPGMVPPAAYAYYAQQIKQAVSLPVIYATRVNSPRLAEQVLRDGKADFVGMLRPLNADPYLPQKAAQGRLDEIVPCVACHQGCYDMLFSDKPIFCLANPQTGYELVRHIDPAARSKRVAVVGGGPGGMEAAVIAARRGHEVTLVERSARLGGQFEVLSAPPGKHDFHLLSDYLQRELGRLGVQVLLNTEANRDTIAGLQPDAVVVATGSLPAPLPVPGAGLPHVVTAHQVLAGEADLGSHVVIIGGNAVGIETALYCTLQGALDAASAVYLSQFAGWDSKLAVERTTRAREVTVLEMMPRAGVDLGRTTRWSTMMQVRAAGINLLVDARVVAIEPNAVVFESGGETKRIAADTVVAAIGARANARLAEELQGVAAEVQVIGDAVRPRKAADAIHEGFLVALSL